MPYDIYLLTYPIARTRFNGSMAHWGIYVPNKQTPNIPTNRPTAALDSSSDVHTVGKVIHVTGTPFTGYSLEFKRNYNLANTSRGWKIYLLDVVDEKHVRIHKENGDENEVRFSVDVVPRGGMEQAAMRVDPPGPSKEPLNPAVGKRCQEWIRDYIAWLIQQGIMTNSTIQILDDVKVIEQGPGQK